MVMNCRRGAIPFVYLGLPIGGDSRKLSFWKSVVDRILFFFIFSPETRKIAIEK